MLFYFILSLLNTINLSWYASNISSSNANLGFVSPISSIKYLVNNGAKVILCSHLGRPNGQIDTKLSMRPVLARLSKLLEKPISFAEDLLDKSTKELVNKMENGDICMLENIRFYPQEEKNEDSFAKKLWLS